MAWLASFLFNCVLFTYTLKLPMVTSHKVQKCRPIRSDFSMLTRLTKYNGDVPEKALQTVSVTIFLKFQLKSMREVTKTANSPWQKQLEICKTILIKLSYLAHKLQFSLLVQSVFIINGLLLRRDTYINKLKFTIF